jgi:hypothetical protein
LQFFYRFTLSTVYYIKRNKNEILGTFLIFNCTSIWVLPGTASIFYALFT